MPLGIIEAKGYDVPGTVLLFDGSSEHTSTQMKHGTGKYANVVLYPQPSDSPNDPLNWPLWKKNLTYIVVFFNAIIFSSIPPPVIAPSTILLSHTLGHSVKDVTMLTAYQLLLTACYGPIASALAHKYGKRPQFLFASLMGFIGTLICCTTRDSYTVLLAGRVIQGFGAAVFESLSVPVIGDMFFVHQRSLRTGFLVMTWTCIISLVSIFGGTIAEDIGWRYVFIVHLPFTVIGLISIILFLPETQYQGSRDNRPSPEARMQVEDKGGIESSHQHDERPNEEVLAASSLRETKKSFVQGLAIYSGTYSDTNLIKLVFAPFAMLLNPAVVWAIAVGAVNKQVQSFFVTISYILAQIWSPPPYNLNAKQNGTFYVGALIGGILSSTLSPFVGDWIIKRLAKWNKGIYEPEFRIPMMIFAALFCGIGCDACHENATEIFILSMTAKNFLFYGFSQFMNDWAEEKGPSEVLRTFGIATMCIMATSPLLYTFGKLNRYFMFKTGLIKKLTG
ncbi:hypothetical protein N7457_009321 [Penicillium paradoxum]|uniref:uncharacterized protein n=1 Tax=Penicillium paradoxum TaxID=176176 RepID=UPI002549352F|nr:uncharacterized protein N7457_009321 [Penicillium paradoxum]KAJ5774425.1 hypothetical protein N7457_009321 [Penicillium paradoxum]